MAISRPQSGDPMQALASWGEDDYEKCDESAQGSWDHSHQEYHW